MCNIFTYGLHIHLWQVESNMQNTTILGKYVVHANALTYITFAVTYAVNKHLFKYFKYVKA